VRAASVLITDDDPDTREMYAIYLTHCGLEVHTAVSGGDAIRSIARDRPDIVLMDFRLPDMDGGEAIRRVRGEPASERLPIIALTGLTTTADRARALSLGCDGFLAKPCSPEDVFNEVTKVLVKSWAARVEAHAQLRQRSEELIAELRINRQILCDRRGSASRLLAEIKALLPSIRRR
jgi:two-component system, cell cycle response regulator DivK